MARKTMAELRRQLAETKKRNRELRAERERLVATVSAGMLLAGSLLEGLEELEARRKDLNTWILDHKGQPPH